METINHALEQRSTRPHSESSLWKLRQRKRQRERERKRERERERKRERERERKVRYLFYWLLAGFVKSEEISYIRHFHVRSLS